MEETAPTWVILGVVGTSHLKRVHLPQSHRGLTLCDSGCWEEDRNVQLLQSPQLLLTVQSSQQEKGTDQCPHSHHIPTVRRGPGHSYSSVKACFNSCVQSMNLSRY